MFSFSKCNDKAFYPCCCKHVVCEIHVRFILFEQTDFHLYSTHTCTQQIIKDPVVGSFTAENKGTIMPVCRFIGPTKSAPIDL